jgi:hypothetical protein
MLEISSPRPRAYGRCLPCKWHSHSRLCSVHRPASPPAAQHSPASANALPLRPDFPRLPACPERRAANRRACPESRGVLLVLINRTGFPSALAMTNPGSTGMGASRLVPPWQNQPAHDSAQSSRRPCTSKFLAPATPLECALAQKRWGGTPVSLLSNSQLFSAATGRASSPRTSSPRSPRC